MDAKVSFISFLPMRRKVDAIDLEGFEGILRAEEDFQHEFPHLVLFIHYCLTNAILRFI